MKSGSIHVLLDDQSFVDLGFVERISIFLISSYTLIRFINMFLLNEGWVCNSFQVGLLHG